MNSSYLHQLTALSVFLNCNSEPCAGKTLSDEITGSSRISWHMACLLMKSKVCFMPVFGLQSVFHFTKRYTACQEIHNPQPILVKTKPAGAWTWRDLTEHWMQSAWPICGDKSSRFSTVEKDSRLSSGFTISSRKVGI